MNTWTRTLSALVVIWAGAVTAATQDARAPQPSTQLRGRVVSANPAHPVAGATVHLVPVDAIDTTTKMTASAIYAAPYPAEAYDEPLEDAIRAKGTGFPHATTDARGNFAIATVPNGKFFVHVTPSAQDTEHLPGGDRSRQSYAADQLRGPPMTIRLSSRPSTAARYAGSSACLACHDDKRHWQQTAHKLGWTVPGAPGRLQDFSRHGEYAKPLEAFVEADDYTRGTRLELGDYDAARGDDKFKLRAFGDERVPIERHYADAYLWKNKATGTFFITMVNRLNPQDPNSPAHLEVKLLYGGEVHDQRYIVSVPPGLAERQGWYTVLRYNMTGRDERLHRERRVWQDYKFYMWWSAGADGRYGSGDDVLTAPPINNNAVQTMCAACHLTGWERYQDTIHWSVPGPGGRRSRRRAEHRRRSGARRDQRRLRELPRPGIGARGQRRQRPVHRQPEAPLGRAVQPDLRPVSRPPAGVRRTDQRLHPGDQCGRRHGPARHQPPGAAHDLHGPGEEGPDRARARARGQHLARRRPLEQAAPAVFGLPEVEDVPQRPAAGGLLGLPRHARRHAVSTGADTRRQRFGVALVPAMP